MRLLRSRIFLALVVVVLACVGLAAVRYWMQERDVAEVRRVFEGDIEAICTNPLPWAGFIEVGIHEIAKRITKDEEKAWRVLSRIRRLSGGHVDVLQIHLTALRGDPTSALGRVPHVYFVMVDASGAPLVSEEDGRKICAALRAMPQFTELSLDGDQVFTDASLAPLSGHPSLRSIMFPFGITCQTIPIFISLPSLEAVVVSDDRNLVSDEVFDALKAALPSRVRVERL